MPKSQSKSRTSRTRMPSLVWKYFIRTGPTVSKCKLCLVEVKRSGNTTNLMNHMTRKHADILKKHEQDENREEINESKGSNKVPRKGEKSQKAECGQGQESETSTADSAECSSDFDSESECKSTNNKVKKKPSSLAKFLKITAPENENTTLRSNRNLATATSTSASASTSSSVSFPNRQPLISQSLRNIESYSSGGHKSSLITNAILYFIAKDNLCLSTTDKEGFKHLMHVVAPLYKVPTRPTVTKLLDEKYEVLSQIMKKNISTVKHFTITTDVWTDVLNTKSFLGITCHFLQQNKFKSLTIGVIELNTSHTAEYLGEKLSTTLNEWNITPEKITAVVTDNGANIVKAVSDLYGRGKHLACFAHSLNLVATKILNEEGCAVVINKVKEIVTFFKHSVSAADELRQAQAQQGEGQLKLKQSVPTRWNSVYFMLERFLKLIRFIAPILIKKIKSPPMLNASEINLIEEITDILKPLETVTTEMCGEKFLTSSKVIPIINCLRKKIESLKPSSTHAQSLKTTLLNEISKRFGTVENIMLLSVATLLDPRFKKIHFDSPASCAQTISHVNKLVKQQTEVEERRDDTGDIMSEDPPSEQNHDIWKFHQELASKFNKCQGQSFNDQGQLNISLRFYLNQNLEQLSSDPILYWHNFEQNNKVFSDVALKFLSVVATSVPSERLFSKLGNILTEKRSRLDGKRMSNLLFLSSLEFDDWNIEVKDSATVALQHT